MSGDVGISDVNVLAEHWLEGFENLDLGLIAHYKLDETSGTIAYDSYGTNDGIANNERVFTSHVDGVNNTGADFTQGDDSINIGSSIGNNEKSISVSAWVKLNSLKVASVVDKAGDWANNRDWSLRIRENEGNYYPMYGVWVVDAYWSIGSTSLQTDSWYHLAGTYNSETNKVRIYVNGILEKEEEYNITRSQTNASAIIGARVTLDNNVASNNFIDGIIDEVRVYIRALTESEIKSLFLENSLKAGLTAHYKLDET